MNIPEPNSTTGSEPVEIGGLETRYELTVEEASRLFAESGTPRSPRTIIRYCAKGHLDSIKADTQQNEKYLIARDSVDRRIEELRQLAVTRRDETGPDMSRRDETGHDTSRHDASDGESLSSESRASENHRMPERVQELEAQVRDLEITNRAKDWILTKMKEERGVLLDQVSTKSHRIGRLEERLRLSPAASPAVLPKRETERARLDGEVDFPD